LSEDCSGTQVPFDLSGVSEIKAIFIKSDNTKLEKKLTDAVPGIVVDPTPQSGKFTIDWDETETALLRKGENLSFEVEIVKATKTFIVPFEKVLTVKARLL
jgi:hypothetical protein